MGNTNVRVQELKKIFEDSSDAFGKLIADGTRNALDLPSFYKFSEERYRFIENGTRVSDPDANSTRFTDTDEEFLLEPNAGDTLQFKTAEAPRYVVGNDADISWSFKFTSALVDASDSFKLFLEGAFEIEYTGDGAVVFRSLEDGVEKKSVDVETPNGLESPSRPQIEFNWYGVGRAEVTIAYTDDNTQKNTSPATLTVDDDWLSDAPTGRMGFELDVSNSGVGLEAGSMAYIPLTSTLPTTRPKPHFFNNTELNEVAATGYTVVGALRVDPERGNVYTTLTGVDVTAEANVDIDLSIKAVPESATDADFLDVDGDGVEEGPAYPRSNDDQNSVIQWTPNVSTFPTRTYAVTGEEIPNGRAVGAATETSAGQGNSISKTGRGFSRKRPIHKDDVILMIGHTPDADTATGINVFIETEQEW